MHNAKQPSLEVLAKLDGPLPHGNKFSLCIRKPETKYPGKRICIAATRTSA